jgi:hypothetical protein
MQIHVSSPSIAQLRAAAPKADRVLIHREINTVVESMSCPACAASVASSNVIPTVSSNVCVCIPAAPCSPLHPAWSCALGGVV